MNCKKADFKINFVGIGAAKSGTTWLANRLKNHPDICLSEPKEVNYFNTTPPMADRYLYGRSENPNRKRSIKWYKDHFRHCQSGKLIGEFSPIYLSDEKAPGNINANFPDIKILLCLRNPVERAYSHYWMYRNYFKVEHRSFEQAIKEEPYYIETGKYYKHLNHYLIFFDKKQIKIIFHDDIREHPGKVLCSVFNFLNVSQIINPKTLYLMDNTAKRMRSQTVVKLMDTTSRLLIHARLMWLHEIIKKLGISRLVMTLNKIDASPPPMNRESRLFLQNFYKEDINNLSLLLNKDLSHWQ